jgi:hypothetical protein
MSEFKGTTGECKINGKETRFSISREGNVGQFIDCWGGGIADTSDQQAQANAELIVEAFNVRQQIPFNLTELKRQRDELLIALQDTLEIVYECDPPKHMKQTYGKTYMKYYNLLNKIIAPKTKP